MYSDHVCFGGFFCLFVFHERFILYNRPGLCYEAATDLFFFFRLDTVRGQSLCCERAVLLAVETILFRLIHFSVSGVSYFRNKNHPGSL